MTTARSAPGCERRRGFVLVAVLWILAALAGLVGVYVAYAMTMASGADLYLRRIRAEAAISGALELAVYDLSKVDPAKRPKEGVLSYRIGDSYAQASFASESLRLDLNKASAEEIASLLAETGVSRSTAENYAARILGWRTEPKEQDSRMEELEYKAAGVGYFPREGPFQSVEELWDVLGLPPDLVAQILPLVTVYGTRSETQSAQQQQQDGGSNAAPAGQQAQGLGLQPDPNASQSDQQAQGDANAQNQLAQNDRSLKPTRFVITVTDARGRKTSAEIVAMSMRDGDEPYYVLQWRSGDDLSAPGYGRRR